MIYLPTSACTKRFLAIALLACCVVSSTFAGTWTWTGNTSNNWGTASNWTSGTNPGTAPISANNTIIIFSGSPTNTAVIQSVAAPFIINSMTFASGLGSMTLYNSPFRFAGTTPAFTNNSTTGTVIIQAQMELAANTTFTGAVGSITTFGGNTQPFGNGGFLNATGVTNPRLTFTGGGTFNMVTPNYAQNSGITIQLNGGGTTLNQLGTGQYSVSSPVNMILNGGTWNLNSFNQTLGTLTLTASSTINMGTSSTAVLTFSNSSGTSWTAGQLLNITNWNGSATGGVNSQILFGTNSSGLTAAQLAQIRFINPAGFSPGTYAAGILSTGEIVPIIPEPSTLLAGFASILAAIGYEIRRRRKSACN